MIESEVRAVQQSGLDVDMAKGIDVSL